MAEQIVLTDLENLQNETTAVSAINSNNSVITQAFTDVLSLSGTAPNAMQSTLDMNNNQIINLPFPSTLNAPLRLVDANTLNGGGTITVESLPAGGTAGQLLTKNSSTDFDASWDNPVGILPTGGTVGQALIKNSTTNYDASFSTIHQPPVGGSTAQVLTKNTGTDYDYSWASVSIPSSRVSTYQLDLRDLLDTQYGVNNWSEFSFNGSTGVISGSDIQPAIVAGLAIFKAGAGRGTIFIPPGIWRMNSGIPAASLNGCYIVGTGPEASGIVFCNANGVAFNWSGLGGFTGGGMKDISIFLGPELGNTNSICMLLAGNATFQADQMEFKNVYSTFYPGRTGHPVSYWLNGFTNDASARSAPQGSRVGTITNMQLFNNHNSGFFCNNLVQWTIVNLGVYTGFTPAANNITIQGGSIHVYGIGLNGNLGITSTSDCWLNGVRYS